MTLFPVVDFVVGFVSAKLREALIYSSPRRKRPEGSTLGVPGSSSLIFLDSGVRRNDDFSLNQRFLRAIDIIVDLGFPGVGRDNANAQAIPRGTYKSLFALPQAVLAILRRQRLRACAWRNDDQASRKKDVE